MDMSFINRLLFWGVVAAAGSAGCSGDKPNEIPDGGQPGDGQNDAGGPNGPNGPLDLSLHYKSGTRLRTRWLTTSDGAKAFAGWRDSQRNQECRWEVVPNSGDRCVPPYPYYPGRVYSDAQCTKMMDRSSGTCHEPLIRLQEGSGAAAQTTFYEVGPRVPVPNGSLPIYESLGGVCQSNYSVEAASIFYAGAVLPPEQLVGATQPEFVDVGSGIEVRTATAADGSKRWGGLRLRGANRDCTVLNDASGTLRCIGMDAYVGATSTRLRFFADAGCTQPTVTLKSGDPIPTVLGIIDTQSYWTTWTIGTAVANTYTKTSAGACQPATPANGFSVVSITKIDSQTYPAVDKIVDRFGKLERTSYAIGNAIKFPSAPALATQSLELGRPATRQGVRLEPWLDVARAKPCQFLLASDGQSRCLPRFTGAYASLPDFADPQCTQKLVVRSGTGTPRPDVEIEFEHNCNADGYAASRYHVFAVGAAYTGPRYERQGGQCVVNTSTDQVTMFRLGAEIAPSTFVLAAESVD